MQVRRIQVTDYIEWLRMRLALWPDSSVEEHQAEMDEYLHGLARDAVFVIERPTGGLGGFLEAGHRAYAEGCNTQPVGYIEGWYVDPDLRRQGLGGRLVGAAEDWARSTGCQEMASDCEAENDVSRCAHLALGYTEAGHSINFCKPLAPLAASPTLTELSFLCLIRPTRPGFFQAPTDTEDQVLAEHFAYQRQAVKAGQVLLAGPCLEETFGIIIIQADSEQAARQFIAGDPAVQQGVMAAELHPLRISLMRKG